MSKESMDKDLNFRSKAKSWLTKSFNRTKKPYYLLSSLFLAATLFYVTPSDWMPKDLSIDKASDHYKIYVSDKLLNLNQEQTPQLTDEKYQKPIEHSAQPSEIKLR
jgi:hypothetical protein